MLIKIQEDRFSQNCHIIENAKHVKHWAMPESFHSAGSFSDFLRGSAPQPIELFIFDDIGPDKPFGPGVICLSLNHISFADEESIAPSGSMVKPSSAPTKERLCNACIA
jgi:hypothetical protein